MRKIPVLLTTVALFLFTGCRTSTSPFCQGNQQEAKNLILPLGASRVQGSPPDYYSYRRDLWKLLIDGGWTFDFLGSQEDAYAYPLYGADCEFDPNHEGHSGYTSGEILSELPSWLNQYPAPDIVLFSSPGGNDALDLLPYSDAIDNINAILDTLQSRNPNITIVIEQMAPPNSWLLVPPLSTYYNDIHQDVLAMAAAHTTATSTVTVVDMATGFDNDMLADPIHYNPLGAAHIAARYYDVLTDLLEP